MICKLKMVMRQAHTLPLSAMLTLTVICALALPARAQDAGQALLDQLHTRPLPQGWTKRNDGTGIILSNDGSAQPNHLVYYTPDPAGELIRSSLLIANLTSSDPNAHLSVFLTNGESLCFLGLYSDRGADLSCATGADIQHIGFLPNILKFDGSDRIQILEQNGNAIFYVNFQELGTVKNHPALGYDFGLGFNGKGEFAINTFSVAYLTEEELRGPAPETPPETAPAPPPKESGGEIPAMRPRLGWQEVRNGSGLTLINEAQQGDEHTIPLTPPPLSAGDRLTEVDVSIAPTQKGEQSLRAAAGLLLENPAQGQSCGIQITAAGDGLLLCYAADGSGVEIARQKGVASGAGPHHIAVFETGDSLAAFVNGAEIGALQSHPVIGGEISLIAWDQGAFRFDRLSALSAARSTSAPPPKTEPRPEGSLGDHLQGPLPLFGNDRQRADAAYLGVTKSILMHELGHALIGELGVPATGPEEDAVDIFSALHLAETLVQASAGRAFAAEAASYASLLWYYSGRLEEQSERPASEGWQDEHTGGLKRFRNMFCVIYGADPRGFSQLAQSIGFEERTLARCEDEFLKQNRAWRAILSPYAPISQAMPEGRLDAAAKGAEVLVEFQPSRRQIGEYIRLTHQEELTRVIKALGQTYVLPRPLKVTFQDCDVVNAWYYPQEGSVTMCYDIVEHFVVLISDIEMQTSGGYSQAELGQAQAPQTAPQVGMTGQVAQAPNELTDFGIPSSLQLFAPPFRGPTPVENPKARTITTPEVEALLNAQVDVILFDVREGIGLQSVPGAWQLYGSGRDGSLQDNLQLRLSELLPDLVGSDKDRPVIIFGQDQEDRAAWNAALRIGQEGYAVNWYRGGVSAWTAAGLPLAELK